MADETHGNGNNYWKSFGAMILVIGAVIGSVTSFVRPVAQRIDFLEHRLDAVQADSRGHWAASGHGGATADLAAIKVKFAEVETQFKAMRDVNNMRSILTSDRLIQLEEWQRYKIGTNAAQEVRILALEKIGPKGPQ